jgi:chorismate dehydratase
MQYRIGVVSYMNAKPLTWALEHGQVPGVEVVLDVPSKLADELRAGRLDAAMLSSVVALREPRFRILAGAGCLAADGPVQSVLLFSKVHIPQIRSVALDTSSITSVALTRILLEQLHGLRPTYDHHPPDLPAMLADHDAALMIGDPGLAQYFRGEDPLAAYDVLDLGRAWRDWTGLPFVFAAWLARDEVNDGLEAILREARELSKRQVPAIAAAEAARLNLPEGVCRFYLDHVMRYDLGEREQAGLARFAELVRQLDGDKQPAGGTPTSRNN